MTEAHCRTCPVPTPQAKPAQQARPRPAHMQRRVAHKCGATRLQLRWQPAGTVTSAWPGRTQQCHLPGAEICLSVWLVVKSLQKVPDSCPPASPRQWHTPRAGDDVRKQYTAGEGATSHHITQQQGQPALLPGQSYRSRHLAVLPTCWIPLREGVLRKAQQQETERT